MPDSYLLGRLVEAGPVDARQKVTIGIGYIGASVGLKEVMTSMMPALTITKDERARLASVAIDALGKETGSFAASMLLREIARAGIIESSNAPRHIVAPHRTFLIRDNINNRMRHAYLTYPEENDTDPNAVSVVSPLGAALIGLSVGDTFEWNNEYGDQRSITVVQAKG